MKKNLFLISFLLFTALAIGQHLVPGSTDVVGLTGNSSDPHLVEADAQSFFLISGTDHSSVNHPLLTEVYSDFANLYFIKYNLDGLPLKSNYIRGLYYASNAFSFNGGLTIMANSFQDVEANGQVIPIGIADQLEFLASYDADCNLTKIINIWNLGPSEYPYSESVMDRQDGSVYLYGTASAQMELVGYGILGKDISQSYFYLIKYNRDLDL